MTCKVCLCILSQAPFWVRTRLYHLHQLHYGCLYAFTVGEDGDILNLGEKKKKKKKKQTSEVVVRLANMQNCLGIY